MSACGSDSDSGSDADTDLQTRSPWRTARRHRSVADTATVGTTVVDTASTDPTADTVPADDSTGGDASADCGDLNAADVGAAVGAEFDTATDVCVDTDECCLFGSSTAADAVTVLHRIAVTYLGGSLEGLSPEEALAQLEPRPRSFFEDPVVEQTTVGGLPAVIVVGTAWSDRAPEPRRRSSTVSSSR